GLVELRHPEAPRVVRLGAGGFADDHVIGLLRHRTGDAAAVPLDQVARRLAGERGQRAGHHDGLPGERLRSFRRDRRGRLDSGRLQFPDQRDAVGLLEERYDRPRDFVADAVYLGQLRLRLGGDDVEAAELRGQERRHARADEPYAQGVEQAGQAARARGVDRPDEVLGRLVGKAVELGDVLGREPVEIGEVLDLPAVDQLLDRAVAQVLNVHRPPRSEMPQALLELGRTGAVGAPPVRLALGPLLPTTPRP